MDTVVTRFEAQVKRTPDKMALQHNHEAVSYGELNQRANQLAHYLQFLGIQPEQLVGICLPRSVDLMVGLLGILKAGAAYVPLDPYSPEKRLADMLEDSQLTCVLLTDETHQTLSRFTPATTYRSVDLKRDSTQIWQQSTDNLSLAISATHLAYCLYTSGSTGRPKAVLMEHASLANLINWHLGHRVTPARQLQFSPISFDISAQEIFATWCSGGCLFLIDEELRRNPMALLEFIGLHQIEKLYLPFTPLQQLAVVASDSGKYPTSVVEVITAGEPLQITPAIKALFQHTQASLHHHYGATECQDVTALSLTGVPDTWPVLPSVGKAIENIQTYILDDTGQPVAAGEIGRLFIGGCGLARGYLHRPELTAQKFIPNPFGAGRLYDTSDRARYLPSGDLELLGRTDNAVKIRGFRVELGEIEAVLSQHEAVTEAVVVWLEKESPPRLAAYVTLATTSPPELAERPTSILRAWLKTRLPDYMIPASVTVLEQLPLTPNGKIDRRALPAPTDSHIGLVLPRTPLEELIAGLWREVLKLQQVGVEDNFFEVGGNSLTALQLLTKFRQKFAVELPLRIILEHNTIAQLADVLENQSASQTNLMTALSVEVLQQFAVLNLETVPPYQATPQPPKAVLLTGATGFIGAFLLHHLLTTIPEIEVYCLVRSDSVIRARQRLLDTQQRYGLSLNQSAQQRLHPLSGDVSQSFLGFDRNQYSQLAQHLDCVYHVAANVNLWYSYKTLQAANVKGTQEVIYFATTQRSKPIHYISSTAIFEAKGFLAQPEPIGENVALEQCETVYGGYAQSKWVAENILQQAKAKGLPVNIYRLGMITGHSKSGYANTEDLLCRLFKLFIQQGQIPQLSAMVDMIPVDYAVQAITHLSQQTQLLNRHFHVTNQSSLSFQQLAKMLNDIGYSVQTVDYQQWLEQLKTIAMDAPNNALGALLPLFTEEVDGKTYLEFSSFSLPIQDDNTRQGLQNSQLSCPPVNIDLLKIYFAYFVRQGVLTAPPELVVRQSG